MDDNQESEQIIVDIKKIESLVEEAGNNLSLFKTTRMFALIKGMRVYGRKIYAPIAFPLSAVNTYKDEPESYLYLLYSDEFAPTLTDEQIAEIIIGYCVQYANTYVKAVAETMQRNNTGKFFNHPKGYVSE